MGGADDILSIFDSGQVALGLPKFPRLCQAATAKAASCMNMVDA